MAFGQINLQNIELSEEGEFFLSPNITACKKEGSFVEREGETPANEFKFA